MSEIYDLLDIHRLRTTSYHPQTDGQSERFMRTIKTMLTAFVNKNRHNWDVQLNRLTYAYNTAIHKTTGFTPFELMFGRMAKLPIDIFYKSPKFQLELELTPDEYAQRLLSHLKAAYDDVRKNRDTRMDKAKINHDQKAGTQVEGPVQNRSENERGNLQDRHRQLSAQALLD